MKRIFYLTAILILSAGVLQGCSAKKQKSQIKVTSRQDDISQVSKAQKIEIVSCRDRKTIAVLKNKDDILKLIGELKIDEWKSVREIPAEEKAAYRCLLYQAETKKLNEDSKGSMVKMGSLTFYKDSAYSSVKILGLQLKFKITADAESILENFSHADKPLKE